MLREGVKRRDEKQNKKQAINYLGGHEHDPNQPVTAKKEKKG